MNRSGGSRLPVEPVPATGGGGAHADETAVRRLFRELRRFHREGARRAAAEDADRRFTPALIHAVKNLSRIRHDYPLCIIEDSGIPRAKPLTSIVDEVVAVATDASDEGQRLKRRIYQLEAAVKKLSHEEPGATLSSLWHRAADEIVASSRLINDDRQMLKQDMNVARGALRAEGGLFPCGAEAPRRIFRAALLAEWERRAGTLRGEIDRLVAELRQILAASFMRTAEAKSPEHLEAAVGDEESVDFQAMSSILRQSHVGDPIPPSRAERIQKTLAVLEGFRPLFSGETIHPEKGDEPFGADIVESTAAAARERHERERRMMATFFKALRIARLEVENRYNEETHDAFFTGFGPANFSEEETGCCPAVPLAIESAERATSESGPLLDLLAGGFPVKAYLGIGDLFDERSLRDGGDIRMRWPARFANAAAGLHAVYVLQAPASDPAFVQAGMKDGFGYPGPAVFAVYHGQDADQAALPAYHCVASACESRVFPAFTYDPGREAKLAGRMDVSRNSRSRDKWSGESFEFATEAGDETAVELAFTPADFLLCDVRAGAHFRVVPPDEWHDDMVPLPEFLELDPASAEARLPYVTAVDPEDRIARILITRSVVDFVRSCAAFWRLMQEEAGIESSFAIAALAGEKQRLEEEKSKEVDAIRKRYENELNRNLGEVTKEVIRRIVEGVVSGRTQGLAGVAAGAGEAAPPPLSPAAEPAARTPQEANEAEEEEDEIVSLDEPYIDTPLCTSCNECVNLNKLMFAYNDNKQAYIKDASAGTFRELVMAAEKCPVHIIHPGKPKNPNESGLDDLMKRAAPFN